MNELIVDKTFEKEDFSIQKNSPDYDNCIFINCDFRKANLSKATFYNCEFIACNLSEVNINRTAFNEVVFKDCKMLGVDFEKIAALLLSFEFDTCRLDFSSFYQLKLINTSFNACSLKEVDFTETDLSNALFYTCDLSNAKFNDTTLTKTDFTTALNFTIDPAKNNMKKAVFSKNNLLGLLQVFDLDIQ